MKRILLSFYFFVIILFSCSKGITFYVHDKASTTIKSQIPINSPVNMPIPPVTSSNTQEYENHKTAPDLIKTVTIEELVLMITNPANENFSFLKSFYLYIKKSDDSNKKLIAYANPIDVSTSTLKLTCTKENLVDYLRESTYKLETEYTVKKVPLHDVNIQINLDFKIRAATK